MKTHNPVVVPRMYESIWSKLQSNPKLVLVLHAPPHLHKRVVKAINKERTRATNAGWVDTDCYNLQNKSEGGTLRIWLKAFAGVTAMADLQELNLTALLPQHIKEPNYGNNNFENSERSYSSSESSRL